MPEYRLRGERSSGILAVGALELEAIGRKMAEFDSMKSPQPKVRFGLNFD
jgi:hypothetical protein